ncbi:divalent-cation tolerance protein CutA [Alcaligenaceae bacterium LF4-65]|jgi:periplasmic divalent cation tolerance protein|uniref:Divalent-cation tolerance protein CutA n=1 Tax=Zwartia hollandica TaxID=324606 RepID=A0A953N6V8_9BURK|nr:divalent-cation tolerance protein CutA [Zwartia hollandica]MBZ1350012.1 divalent-cation tolerance protein CutA [Zwartia hollandica]
MNQTDIVLVLSNAPDEAVATRIAEALVSEGLAACVNVGAPVQSVYRWQGALEKATEIPLTIKTTVAKQAKLIARLIALHPYDVPEAIVVPILGGYAPYLNWVREN